MPIPVFPNPISLQDLQDNFGGTNPISINEYYRRGALVADITQNALIPTSGAISLQDFYGSVSKITVTNNTTRTNVNMVTEFTINGINYWSRNIEKEYINNGTIGSNNATTPALIVNGSRQGAFTLTNNGNIYGAGGTGAPVLGLANNPRSDGQAGGTGILNGSSNYTIVNSSTGRIYGGGGGGARGRNGGDGGQGGDGRYGSGFVTNTERQVLTAYGGCYGGTGGYPSNTVVTRNGSQVHENYSAGPPPGGGWTRINVRSGRLQCEVFRGTGRNRVTWRTFEVEAVFRRTITTQTFTNVNGCAGVSQNTTGGAGGLGQGYQNQAGPGSGATGSAATNLKNCCPDSNVRGAGCGGARGKGGNGSSGGTWGQPGGSQETSSALSGQTGDNGFNAETNTATAGRAGRSPGVNPSNPGRGGYYIEGSAGNIITFTNTGSILGGAT